MISVTLNPSFIERAGKKEFAVIPFEEFEKLQILLRDIEDLVLLRQAKAEDDGTRISLTEMKYQLGISDAR